MQHCTLIRNAASARIVPGMRALSRDRGNRAVEARERRLGDNLPWAAFLSVGHCGGADEEHARARPGCSSGSDGGGIGASSGCGETDWASSVGREDREGDPACVGGAWATWGSGDCEAFWG